MGTGITAAGAHAVVAATDLIPASKAGVKGYHAVGSITYLKSEVASLLRGTAAAWMKSVPTAGRAALDLDFENQRFGLLDNPALYTDLVQFSRASSAYDTLADGSLSLVASGVPRFGGGLGFLSEPARTNSVRNNQNVGAVIGSPGTMPTNWVSTLVGGISSQIVGTGIENGIPYIDIRYSGTATSTGPMHLAADGPITSTIGTSVANSVYAAIVAGSLANVSSFTLQVGAEPSYTTMFASGAGTSGAMARFTHIRTLAATNAVPYVRWNALDTVSPIDFTVRLGMFQCEVGATYVTSPIPTSGTAATRAADQMRVIGSTLTSAIGTGSFSIAADLTSPASATVGGGLVAFGTANEASPSANDETQIATAASPANSYQATSVIGGSNVFTNAATAGNAPPARTKVAAKFAANDFAISHNGAAVITDVSGAMPTTAQTRLAIGSDPAALGTNSFMGRIRRIVAWPSALSSTDLQSAAT